ncbi:hypothetical protein UPYG_G00050660 [Umbra pygmaea]|uniref:Uncharacterized protein n=1 Tax=Umbra pygmaea TaxID=75934 RepID=A0ABD0XWH5_UMBPY
MIECEKDRAEINMKKVFITTVYILLALCSAESQVLDVTGVVGGKVDIKCSHKLARDNNKYFCKGTCKGKDILIQTGDIKNNMLQVVREFKSESLQTQLHPLDADESCVGIGIPGCCLDFHRSPTPPHITSTRLRPLVTVSRTMVSRLLPSVPLEISWTSAHLPVTVSSTTAAITTTGGP